MVAIAISDIENIFISARCLHHAESMVTGLLKQEGDLVRELFWIDSHICDIYC
jgi:hypothetical protein